MAARIRLNDSRWFADNRPICVIENELKSKLKVHNEIEYKKLLQDKGYEIYKESMKVPDISLLKQYIIENTL